MNENENVRIDPESAYVKSMDYLDKVIAEAELTSQKIGKYRIACAVISVLLGGLLMWSFGAEHDSDREIRQGPAEGR